MPIQVSSLTPVATEPVETGYRRIRTPIPVPESIELIERLRRVEPRSMFGMPPVVWHEAEGFLVRDPYGNQWIDLTSGIVMANTGHSHPRVMQAIRDQLDSRLIFSYAFPTEVREQAVERIAAVAPELLSIGVEKHQAAFSSGTWLTGTPLTYLAPW